VYVDETGREYLSARVDGFVSHRGIDASDAQDASLDDADVGAKFPKNEPAGTPG
jgi:hypothetical protein